MEIIMIVFDFFDNEKNIVALSELYGINIELIRKLKQDVTIPFDNIEIESYDNDIHTTG